MADIDTDVNLDDLDGAGGGNPPEPEKTFTQAEVNGIIADRLSREGIHDAKEIVELLKDFGYEGSPAEIKMILREQAKEVKANREQAEREQELEDLQDQARQTGTSPELLAEIKALKAEIKAIKKKDEEKTAEAAKVEKMQQEWNEYVAEFKEKHSDIDLDKLVNNTKFQKFFNDSNPKLTLTQIYENYVDLVGGAEKAAIEKLKSNIDRSTSSGRSKGIEAGGTYGLTARQQELADEAGISYKKFAANLSLIKK